MGTGRYKQRSMRVYKKSLTQLIGQALFEYCSTAIFPTTLNFLCLLFVF